MRKAIVAVIVALILAALLINRLACRPLRRATVDERLGEYGQAARQRMAPDFVRAGVAYPPGQVVLVGLKQERTLQIYAAADEGAMRFIRAYPILAASGQPGPKLREGDRQVPEGIYGIESLNPNSRFHLALRVNYPNAFDREMGQRDGRQKLGGDIMIHGRQVSAGCLAMGDEAAEDLFVLAADAGLENIAVILSPADLRSRPAPPLPPSAPAWAATLHERIRAELARLPAPPVP